MLIKVDLLNVILRLHIDNNSTPLARINFIKSRLTVESFSNLSQDVDLISQEILLVDTRSKSNVFTNILQPIHFNTKSDIVQAEVHNRKRDDHVKFTVLLNNIRLMAIFDWWDAMRRYVLEDFDVRPKTNVVGQNPGVPVPFELKLNITDSEIVIVENMAQWDTNAVILKVGLLFEIFL